MSRLAEESSSCSVASALRKDLQPVEDKARSSSSKTLRVTSLSDEWGSSKGGLSTINKELAIQLAEHPNVEVSVFLPQCSEEDKRAASGHNVQLIVAEKLPGYDPIDWLSSVPKNHAMDCVIGNGVHLGRQISIIKKHHDCKWIQVVHTAPEELGKYKTYADAISKGEKKHQVEVKLCELADQVVAVGPKLAEAYRRYLRSSQKDQAVLNLTPSIFSQFSHVKQAIEERNTFSVLVFGRGDSEDFDLKGYDIAVQAVAKLKESSYHLMFVGAPVGKEDEVAKKLEQYGIDRRQLTVRCFNKSREFLANLFCEVDLVIMPSRTEGFGLTALEALSAGLPILVSSNSGFGEALKKVPCGSQCVVDSKNPKKWAKAIRAVREKDREVRLEEARLLREMYADKFSWKEGCGSLVETMFNITKGTTADEVNSPVISSRQLSPVKPDQASQRATHSVSDPEDQSESLASGKRKRSVSPSGIQAPKHCRLATDGQQDHITLVVKILQAEYKRRSLVKPLLWDNTIQLPLDDIYTRLKILSRRKLDFQLENNAIDMYDVFEFVKGEDGMILVEGSPGIGKTTFCLKLAYDWGNKRSAEKNHVFPLHVFGLVILLKCRDIEGDVMEAISDQLLPRDLDETTKNKLMDFIKDIHNQEKILIILDGLDELPTKSKGHVDQLLNRRILPFCYVLATCRQERGISARKEFNFDILLQIEGFMEKDASEYIKRHFENICPATGHKLIAEIHENSFLHALCTNPLNLLLLCVVFEDCEGKLPSSRTELYQIIVCCLLRRYCAKHGLIAHDDDKALEKQFEESLLALGYLAWKCLLEDRHCFCEGELAKLERSIAGLVARYLGLVYKEASLKKIKPEHEYYFLHKTFQEFLAATYLAQKLRKDDINVFHDYSLMFDDIVTKYRQVFLFACGILDEEASILFRQIGEELLKGDWDWLECSEKEATFFTECFNESSNSEKVAVTLCLYIPFPREIKINHTVDYYPENFVLVLKACQTFSQVKQPVDLTITDADFLEDCEVKTITDVLASSSQLENLWFSANEMTSTLADALFEGLSTNSTLSYLSLKVSHGIPPDQADIIGKALVASKSLRTVMLFLNEERSEAWASALEQGLSAETPLTSVILYICGSMSQTSIQALINMFLNKSLISLTIIIAGDMQDFLASAVCEGLTAAITLESFQLTVSGKLSCPGAISLEKGFLQNQSLKSLEVCVHGEEVPENWTTVVGNVISSKKPLNLSCDFHPSIFHKDTDTE